MQSIEVIYKFGNLYDKNTKERILIDDGVSISITLDPKDVLLQDPNLKPDQLLTAEEKEAEVKAFIRNKPYWKVLSCDTNLYFKISAGIKRKEGTEAIECLFKVRLLEDLYIYNKKIEAKYARFFNCHCKVESCLSNFEFFEPIYATSLNDAYTKTYELYFAMFGKSTCNAFDRFSQNESMTPMIRELTESLQQTKAAT